MFCALGATRATRLFGTRSLRRGTPEERPRNAELKVTPTKSQAHMNTYLESTNQGNACATNVCVRSWSNTLEVDHLGDKIANMVMFFSFHGALQNLLDLNSAR